MNSNNQQPTTNNQQPTTNNQRKTRYITTGLALLLVCALGFFFYPSIARFISSATTTGTARLAEWNVKLNDKDFTETTTFTLTPDESEYTDDFAPGMTATGTITLEPNKTQTAFTWLLEAGAIKVGGNPLPDGVNIEVVQVDVDGKEVLIEENKVGGLIDVNTEEDVDVKLTVKWTDGDGAVESAWAEGLTNTTMQLPLTMTAKQYSGGEYFASKEKLNLATASWADIKTAANKISKDTRLSDGDLNNSDYTYIRKTYGLSVGDEKTIPVGGDGADNYTIRIIGFNHDELTDPTDAQGEYAGITFEFKNCYSVARRMNATSTNEGSWEATEMRSYLQSDFMGYLPSELQPNIENVDKITAATYNGTENQVTNDTLFLLAAKECHPELAGGTAGAATAYSNLTEWNALKSYRYYITNSSNSALVKKRGDNGSTVYWWERSSYYNSSIWFCNARSDGSDTYSEATFASYIAFSPAFCL